MLLIALQQQQRQRVAAGVNDMNRRRSVNLQLRMSNSTWHDIRIWQPVDEKKNNPAAFSFGDDKKNQKKKPHQVQIETFEL